MERKLVELNTNQRLLIFSLSLSKQGWKNEVEKSIEELSEFIQAILKHKNNPNATTEFNLIDEAADTYVTVTQLSLIFDYNIDLNLDPNTKISLKWIKEISELINLLCDILSYNEHIELDMIKKWHPEVINDPNEDPEKNLYVKLSRVKNILAYLTQFFSKEINQRIDYKLLRLKDRLS